MNISHIEHLGQNSSKEEQQQYKKKKEWNAIKNYWTCFRDM